jgi:hypothetical protein
MYCIRWPTDMKTQLNNIKHVYLFSSEEKYKRKMFRKYKENNSTEGKSLEKKVAHDKVLKTKSEDNGYANKSKYSIDSVLPFVRESWNQIELQCSSSSPFTPVTRSKGEWKTIRLFVSSTFTDFHNEREILVKKVGLLVSLCVCHH